MLGYAVREGVAEILNGKAEKISAASVKGIEKVKKDHKEEPIVIDDWRAAAPTPRISMQPAMVDGLAIVKEERMHGNKLKQILCDQQTGKIIERVIDIA